MPDLSRISIVKAKFIFCDLIFDFLDPKNVDDASNFSGFENINSSSSASGISDDVLNHTLATGVDSATFPAAAIGMGEANSRDRRQLWPIVEGLGQKIYEGWHSGHIGDFLKMTKSLFGSSTNQMLENNGHDSAFVEKSKTTFELLQNIFVGEIKTLTRRTELIMGKLAETEAAESHTLTYISVLNVASLGLGGVLLLSLWIMFFYCKGAK
jgi:hypothetical protein